MSVKGKNNKEFPKLDFGYLVQFQDGEFGEVSLSVMEDSSTGETYYEQLIVTKEPISKTITMCFRTRDKKDGCFHCDGGKFEVVKVYGRCRNSADYKPFSTYGRELLWERADTKKDIEDELNRCKTLDEVKKLLVKHGVEDYGLSEEEATAIYDLAEAMAKLTVDGLFSE